MSFLQVTTAGDFSVGTGDQLMDNLIGNNREKEILRLLTNKSLLILPLRTKI
jgi:hypothetical protein